MTHGHLCDKTWLSIIGGSYRLMTARQAMESEALVP